MNEITSHNTAVILSKTPLKSLWAVKSGLAPTFSDSHHTSIVGSPEYTLLSVARPLQDINDFRERFLKPIGEAGLIDTSLVMLGTGWERRTDPSTGWGFVDHYFLSPSASGQFTPTQFDSMKDKLFEAKDVRYVAQLTGEYRGLIVVKLDPKDFSSSYRVRERLERIIRQHGAEICKVVSCP